MCYIICVYQWLVKLLSLDILKKVKININFVKQPSDIQLPLALFYLSKF